MTMVDVAERGPDIEELLQRRPGRRPELDDMTLDGWHGFIPAWARAAALLQLPHLLDSDPPAPQEDVERSPFSRPWRYNPDGTGIEGTYEVATARAEVLRKDRSTWRIAEHDRWRGGVQLWVSTVFLFSSARDTDDGRPLLWETMIFYRLPGWSSGQPYASWKYASRAAALSGHRRVLACLAEHRGAVPAGDIAQEIAGALVHLMPLIRRAPAEALAYMDRVQHQAEMIGPLPEDANDATLWRSLQPSLREMVRDVALTMADTSL